MGNDLYVVRTIFWIRTIRVYFDLHKQTISTKGKLHTTDPGNTEIPGVEPLHDTPESVSLDPRLASVLGHEAGDVEHNTQSRRRLSYGSSQAVVPVPVQELLLNKPKPCLNDKERSDVPLIQRQSKITFVSDENIASNC